MRVQTYTTPQDYLDNTQKILEERELENNTILGLCNSFSDKRIAYDGCHFVNVYHNDVFQATAIKTAFKAIVSGTTTRKESIQCLADYYWSHQIDLAGAMGENFYVHAFSEYYPKEKVGGRSMLVYGLTEVNPLPLAAGTLEGAQAKDKELFVTWACHFYEEAGTFPKKKREEVVAPIMNMIDRGTLFTWVDRGNIVSIAALVRKTKNIGIVGLVYTPPEMRGKGYATSCVQMLSGYILRNGFRQCGLFTDKSNPISNSIYSKIGYKMSPTEYRDIEFK